MKVRRRVRRTLPAARLDDARVSRRPLVGASRCLAGVVVLFDGERQRRGSVLLLGYQASSNNSTADALLWGLRLRHAGSRFG